MRVQINGEERNVPEPQTLLSLLEFLALPRERIAVEYNRAVVSRDAWGQTPVAEGDRIEIVHFVGGGFD